MERRTTVRLAALAMALAHAHAQPRITTTSGDVAVQVAAGRSFSISCPEDGGDVTCSGPNVEVVDGECRPTATFATSEQLDAAVLTIAALEGTVSDGAATFTAALASAQVAIASVNSTVQHAMTPTSPHQSTYIAWYTMVPGIVGLRGGERDVRVYGPGLDALYSPGYAGVFRVTATSTADAAHTVTVAGTPMQGEDGHGSVQFEMPEWPHGVGTVAITVQFIPDGGMTVPYRGAAAGDQLALSRFFTGASILSNNTVVITGTSLDDAPNTYQCTFTDVEGRVTTSSGGQDGERVLDDNTVTCGTLPTGMAIRVIPWGTDEGNEPMIQAVVGLRRRDSAGNWQPVSFAPDSTVAERSVATNACSDGVRNGDESDVDCGGDYCGVCALNQACSNNTHCDAASAHGCVNNRCILIGYTSCKHAKTVGQNENGLYNILVAGAVEETYCDQQTRGGGWTMVMRVSDFDNGIDFRHGGGITSGGQGWNSRGYSTARNANADSCSGPVRGCSGTDFVHPGYGTLTAKNIMLRNALASTNRQIITTDNCLRDRTLRSILIQRSVDGGRACCSGIVYGSGTRVQGPYRYLVLRGDEAGDTEPGVIGTRCGCACDSEMMMLGNYQPGGDRSGNKEVHSQGNYWGNFHGMWVFVRE